MSSLPFIFFIPKLLPLHVELSQNLCNILNCVAEPGITSEPLSGDKSVFVLVNHH